MIIKPDDLTGAGRSLAPAIPDSTTTAGTAPPATSKFNRWLGLESRLALLLGSIGLAVALRMPARLWQSLAALLTFNWGDILDRPTPFEGLNSPHPLLPLAALALWLQGALGLLWLRSPAFQPSAVQAPASEPGRSAFLKPALLAAGLLAIVGLALAVRAGLLLPGPDGRLPASDYDEMVYFSGASLIAGGHQPYRDFFLAHPPAVELFYALVLKAGGLSNGGYPAFLLARWSAIMLGLLTVAGTAWVAGRLWSERTGFAAGPALLAAGLYAADARAGGVATLETPANFCSLLSLGLFLEAGRRSKSGRVTVWWLGSGALLGLAVLCKLPAAGLGFGLAGYLLLARQWRGLAWLGLGVAGLALAVMGPLALLAGPGQVVRQVVLFQLLRPQEVRAGLDQVGRLADYPHSALTVLAGGAGLLWLALWLVRGGRDQAHWLIPALWSLPLLAVFLLGKSFHPWYYVQWALPLALLGGGLASPTRWTQIFKPDNNAAEGQPHPSRRSGWLFPAAAVLMGLIALPLLYNQWQTSRQPQLDRVYRPAAEVLGQAPEQAPEQSPALVFDPGYTFMAATRPVRLPSDGRYLVDSAGYMIYLNLNLDRRGLLELLAAGLNPDKTAGQVEALFRQDRAQALVTEGLAAARMAVLDGKLALPQLTPRSVEFVGTAAVRLRAVDYADIYRLRPWPGRRPRIFDNGLLLTPLGMSVSREGQANAVPVVEGEIIRLRVEEAGRYGLDLRFIWRVARAPEQDIKLFVHVLDEAGERVAQRDLAPLDGQAQTRQWRPGDAFQDVHSLPLPAGLPPGQYRVEVGIYEQAGGQRIGVEGQASLRLGYLEITPA